MFEFLFKYSPAVFQDSEFILANGWPLWLMVALGGVFAAVLGVTLFWKRRILSPPRLAAIGLLQLAMVALVLFVLWQPALLSERLVSGENAVAVMLDTSRSMTFVDGERTRMQQARDLLTEDNLAEIREQYTIQPYGFDGTARPLPSFEEAELPAPGETTDLGRSLLQSLRQSSSASLGAVILLSDGADNGNGLSQSQLNEIASYGVPVHTIGLGREEVPEDLELQEVSLPDKAPPGTTLPARVSIRHDQGGTARIKVYDGDTFLANQEVELNPEQTTTVSYIDIEAPEPGQMDLRFTLDPLPGERNLDNNSRSQVVDIPENRYRILYVEGEPRWEYKFMRRALQDDPSIRLTTLLQVSPNKYYRQGIDNEEELAEGFPAERAGLFDYDALIIGSVEVADFSEQQQQLIHDFVNERGGSLMMLAGRNGLGQGGWDESVVHEILPARLSPEDSEFVREKAPVALTESGKAAPMLQFSGNPGENETMWSELPEIADYQTMGSLRPAATTLMNVDVEGRMQPLLVSQPYGRGHSYILATGGTWRWQMSMPVEDMRHETFWRQLTRDMVANSPRPFELSTRTEDGDITLRAEIRDPGAEQNQGLEITAVASSENNEAIAMDLQPVPGRPGAFEGSFTPPGNGLYSIEAISRRGDEAIDSTRTATRYEQGREAFGTRQNRALLERIAAATGGGYWTPEQWDGVSEAVSYSTAGITERQVRYLWDAPFFFFLLVMLKSAEWLLRRRWRAI